MCGGGVRVVKISKDVDECIYTHTQRLPGFYLFHLRSQAAHTVISFSSSRGRPDSHNESSLNKECNQK